MPNFNLFYKDYNIINLYIPLYSFYLSRVGSAMLKQMVSLNTRRRI